MRVKVVSAPPPLPPPLPPSPTDERLVTQGPSGVMQERLAGLCSVCFTPLGIGTLLSNDELLCEFCASDTFFGAEQLDTSPPPRPRVTLLARVDACGKLLADDLDGVTGRARELLASLRVGEELRICACVHSQRMRGRVGVFVGFCVRRHLALLRCSGSLVAVRMPLLRRPNDGDTAVHTDMMRWLTRLATVSTLQHALAAVRRSHTLCGSDALLSAERALGRLAAAQPGGSDYSDEDWDGGVASLPAGGRNFVASSGSSASVVLCPAARERPG